MEATLLRMDKDKVALGKDEWSILLDDKGKPSDQKSNIR